MGSGASRRPEEGELRLPACDLRFSQEQLRRLNAHLCGLLDPAEADSGAERARAAAHAVVERLVQRLLCAVGSLDPRFSCKYLAALDPAPHRRRPSYLVRLDGLSAPQLYPEDRRPTCRLAAEGLPQGFARLRPQGEGAEDWAEFLGPSGFLRRDKLQERFVELLAQAAASACPPSGADEVDESVLCGCPGKVLDVGLLDQLLRVPADQQVFYGAADWGGARFPDPRDLRIAIAEGSPQVSLRVGFLSPALPGDLEADLCLAVGFEGWPSACDFPARVPLWHADCLLFQRAAQTGFYAVPAPPHPSLRCDDRPTAWRLCTPAAEAALLAHHAASSTPARVLAAAEAVLDHLKGRLRHGGMGLPPPDPQEQLRALGRRLLRTLLWFQLEESPPDGAPASALLAWSRDSLSSHVLLLLDSAVAALRSQRRRCYFFPRLNAALAHPRLSEDDYLRDAALLARFVARLGEASAGPRAPSLDPEPDPAGDLEERLLRSWAGVLRGLPEPARCSDRQLDYLALLLREALRVRRLALQDEGGGQWEAAPAAAQEDLAYLLAAVLEQVGAHAHCGAGFEAASRRLVERARSQGLVSTPAGDRQLVSSLLQWLQRGVDEDSRHLGPALRPYLQRLRRASSEAGWHLEELRRRDDDSEERALAAFSRAVSRGDRPADEALRDAASKGWLWAGRGAGEEGVALVLAPRRGVVLRRGLGPPHEARSLAGTLRERRATLQRAAATLPALLRRQPPGPESPAPAHCRLRDLSPWTATLEARRRYGQHRGPGDPVQALLALRKFAVLQELSAGLPDGERRRVLDAVHRASRASRRAAAARRAVLEARAAPAYRPRCELDRAPAADPRLIEAEQQGDGELLVSCRAARAQHQLGRGPAAAFNGALLSADTDFYLPPLHLRARDILLPDAGLLQLTEDRRLQLSDPGEVVQTSRRGDPPRRRDIVTKL